MATTHEKTSETVSIKVGEHIISVLPERWITELELSLRERALKVWQVSRCNLYDVLLIRCRSFRLGWPFYRYEERYTLETELCQNFRSGV